MISGIGWSGWEYSVVERMWAGAGHLVKFKIYTYRCTNFHCQPCCYRECVKQMLHRDAIPDSKVHGANMGPIWGWGVKFVLSTAKQMHLPFQRKYKKYTRLTNIVQTSDIPYPWPECYDIILILKWNQYILHSHFLYKYSWIPSAIYRQGWFCNSRMKLKKNHACKKLHL